MVQLPSDFPIDMTAYRPLSFRFTGRGASRLTRRDENQLKKNIATLRDLVVFCTALANTKGLGGHTGGPYDIVPEDEIVAGFVQGEPERVHHELLEDAGHRAMLRYIRAAMTGLLDFDLLLHYREQGFGLYGHPERDDARGIWSSTGRLGHDSAQANGLAELVRPKKVVLFGSDGAMQEGINTEAIRYAASNNLPVVWVVDYNDMTIEGPVSRYLPQFNPATMFNGGWRVLVTENAENLDDLFGNMKGVLASPGPAVAINKRPMAVGIPQLEGTPKAHDVIPVPIAINYLEERGQKDAVAMLKANRQPKRTSVYLGSSSERGSNRSEFGKMMCRIIEDRITRDPEYEQKILVVSNDLGGSCGLGPLQERFPDRYRSAIMEPHNLMLAAGFGRKPGHQAIYGTFSAFLEMIISQITMARMNRANVLVHLSHAGVDDMADNECHFGTNIFYANCGPESDDTTQLYFPADPLQMEAILQRIFDMPGLRFVFSTRSTVPFIYNEKGKRIFDPAEGYVFEPGKDEVIRTGTDGYIVSYGEMLYRCLDVVERLNGEGVHVGLVNKPTLHAVDRDVLKKVGAMPFVLVVESQNRKTGLGIRYGTWLLEQGLTPLYAHMGAVRGGTGGLEEQIGHQGLGQREIYNQAIRLHQTTGV